ncbi:hypothetical protein TEA_027895 [Camellia sinensis var. sinensis]|uniref:Pectinesterase inhibitor domain-containing protein n=1 Tax=Camellia sinensis var. sinensis TaxID=542762 RepID=A0A4S4DGQ7_CAMSN|nr:hypothetical protein TEA_027895 [Camellia sinensis var. sinensis]
MLKRRAMKAELLEDLLIITVLHLTAVQAGDIGSSVGRHMGTQREVDVNVNVCVDLIAKDALRSTGLCELLLNAPTVSAAVLDNDKAGDFRYSRSSSRMWECEREKKREREERRECRCPSVAPSLLPSCRRPAIATVQSSPLSLR